MNERQIQTALEFIEESNRIEGIHRAPTKAEVEEFGRFMSLTEVTVDELVKFVSTYQQNAKIRDRPGLDVRVGKYFPPAGGIEIKRALERLLINANSDNTASFAYTTHLRYEDLHPFTDCNGRSGRMLWAWQMGWDNLSLGFLHKWYYMSLQDKR